MKSKKKGKSKIILK